MARRPKEQQTTNKPPTDGGKTASPQTNPEDQLILAGLLALIPLFFRRPPDYGDRPRKKPRS